MARTSKEAGAGGGSSENDPEASPEDAGLERAEPAEVADYIASMTAELVRLARASKLDFVAHLLDMARAAAAEAAGPAGRPDRGR